MQTSGDKMTNKKGLSIIEFMVLFVIIIAAFMIMRNYIQRGLFGKWKEAGQSFTYGRQYDPSKTVECSFDEQSNLWYDRNCFDYLKSTPSCVSNSSCDEAIITNGSCSASSCSQINGQ